MKTDFLGWGFFSVRFEASLKKKKTTTWGFSRETPVVFDQFPKNMISGHELRVLYLIFFKALKGIHHL